MLNFIVRLALCLLPLFSLAAHAVNDFDRTPCTTCFSADEFWVYGAGYLFEPHNGALAALGNNDRIVVVNPESGIEYTIDVDNIDAAVCFFYCISYPPRGRWKVHYQRHGDSELHSKETFLNVLMENYREIQKREQQREELEKRKEDNARRALYERIASRGYRPSAAEIAFLNGQSSSLYIKGERGEPPPCHGINGNSGTRCYRR